MSTTKSPTILYVDDEETNRRAFTWIFRSEGYRVTEAATGDEALRLAEEGPDLVILDVNLPDMDGFEVCRRIKAHPRTAAIPVLHMSARFVRADDKRHGLDAGADGYLVKPVEPEELLAHARALLRARRAEDEYTHSLRERAQLAGRLQLLLESTGEGIYGIDPEGRATFLNRAGSQMLGHSPAEFVGKRVHALIHHHRADGSSYPLEQCPILQSARAGLGCRVEHEVLWRRDGTSFPAAYSAFPIREGALTRGAVVVFTDVTERRRLEDQLTQAQKLEALGRLAGGVAHDFNNLLTAIVGNLSLALSELPDDSSIREYLRVAETASLRAADLTRRLLGFSRQSLLHPLPIFLDELVVEVAGLLQSTTDPRISLVTHWTPGLWPVRADPGQLHQVLMNLALNARDAMPQGGRLLLQAENFVLEAGDTRLHLEAQAGAYVRMRVADTGHGMTPEVRARIFEPFFTTKEVGQGTGLGLATVFGVVKQHGGWVECVSAVSQGTRFDLYLPRCLETPERTQTRAQPKPAGGGETILLVDDEPMLRTLGQSILSGYGYQVILAQDGEEALEVYQRERGRIALVVLDLSMPRLSGRDALPRLLELNPRARVLLVSGFGAEDVAEAHRGAFVESINKPYRPIDLAQAVRNLLDYSAVD
jgi:PAS domain S-box-containing protein